MHCAVRHTHAADVGYHTPRLLPKDGRMLVTVAFIKILSKRQVQGRGRNVSQRGVLVTAFAMSVCLSFLLKVRTKQSSLSPREETYSNFVYIFKTCSLLLKYLIVDLDVHVFKIRVQGYVANVTHLRHY
jgi:hypothetical protein